MIDGSMYRVMREEEEEYRLLMQALVDIHWYIQHPPPLFLDPGTGTDQLRTRPRIEIAVLRKSAEVMLAELALLHRSHYDRYGKEWKI
jgi:hypothetical protein